MGKIKKKSKVGSRTAFDPFAPKKVEYERDYGQFSIAKIHGVYEDLGLVIGELDENVTGAIPIEWFVKVREGVWRPNGLACPHIYMEDRRQWAIDKYNEIKDKINEDKKSDQVTAGS